MWRLYEPCILPSILSLPTILNHQQRLRLIFTSLHTLMSLNTASSSLTQLVLIRSHTKLQHRRYMWRLYEPCILPSILLLPTILNHQQRLRLIFTSLHTLMSLNTASSSLTQLVLIRSHTKLQHRRYKCSLHEPCILPSILSLPTIMNHQQRLRLISTLIHTYMCRNTASSTLNWPTSGRIWDCSIAATSVDCMSRVYYLLYYRCHL